MAADRPKIVIVGCDGQVGWELQRTLGILGDVVATSLCGSWGPALDLLDRQAVTALIQHTRPDFIINAAAHTAVDKAETEVELSHQLNAEAPEQLAILAAEQDATMIHYSTDFVFPGDTSKPYTEEDATGPLGVYGVTKLAGEKRVLGSGANALILRTSWVYGNRGSNFMKTMMRLFKERDQLNVVADQIGAPTWSRMIAEATAQIVHQLLLDPAKSAQLGGIYNLTAAGETSWHGFACRIRELMNAQCNIQAIPTHEYPTPARRPAYSVLDNTKLQQTFGLKLPEWQASLKLCMEDQIQPWDGSVGVR